MESNKKFFILIESMPENEEKEFEFKEEDNDTFNIEIRAKKRQVQAKSRKIPAVVISGMEEIIKKIPGLAVIGIKGENGGVEWYIKRDTVSRQNYNNAPALKESRQKPPVEIPFTVPLFQGLGYLFLGFHYNSKQTQDHGNGFDPLLQFIINQIKPGTIKHDSFNVYFMENLVKSCLEAFEEKIPASKGELEATKATRFVIKPLYSGVQAGLTEMGNILSEDRLQQSYNTLNELYRSSNNNGKPVLEHFTNPALKQELLKRICNTETTGLDSLLPQDMIL